MPIALRQSTASQEVPLGVFVDSADGNTERGDLTINNTDIKLWKCGAASMVSASAGANFMSNGIYSTVFSAGDTDTVGPLVVFIHVNGALPVRLECEVLPASVYDNLFTSPLEANAQAVWEYAARTLTNFSAASPNITGERMTFHIGDTIAQPITGLGSLAGYVAIDFTVKTKKTDLDTAAKLRIRKAGTNGGLLRLNGAGVALPITSADGEIQIDDESAGDLTIKLSANASSLLAAAATLYYDIQLILPNGVVRTLAEDFVTIESDVTKTIV
jgi:phage baseplate assembly protein gpV